MTDSTPNENSEPMSKENKNDPRTDNYRELLAKLRAHAEIPRPSIFGLVAEPDTKQMTAELEIAHAVDIAILSAKVIFDDLAWQGVDPDLARLIVLALLAVDNAPIANLREEVVIAAHDVVQSRLERLLPKDGTKPAAKSATLFSERNWVLPATSDDNAPAPAAAETVAIEEAAPAEAPVIAADTDLWTQATVRGLFGVA
jgi:hypothetical protein